MEYVRLGWSGLKVSRICLGTMSFGDPALQAYGGGAGSAARRMLPLAIPLSLNGS
ncbi:MAG: hypothetical protein QW797_04125 [Thermoproteota archaeon]